MPEIPISEIRKRLLKDRGLITKQPKSGHKRRLSIKPNLPTPAHHKTALMQMLEMKFGNGQSIWDILQSGSLSAVRKRLGNEVDVSTISKWIKRYKLKYTEANLPDCDICQHHKPWCELGACNVLMELELWDLMEIKKREVLSNAGNQSPNQET